MGKSSSSLKKKRSKKSSKDRTSRRSKSRKYKSKKLRRREVYLFSSDSDDSESMSTSLSSSSDDSYRRKRARSRVRKDVKGHRKKAQKRSYSRDSSDSSPRVRKRKRSKRKNDNVREKPQKKKLRKEASVSSMSGRSWSCSTCQGGDAGCDGSEVERYRGRSERTDKDKRRLERGRSESVRRGRYRARSCSSCSHSSESSDERTKEKYMCENNSRRLRSVITVTKGAEGGRELFTNESKEEIVDDHDYPSRSNDSNDGGGKRDPSSEEKVSVEDEKGDEYADFSKSNVYVARISDDSEDSLDIDDLESILRQRAIENLRKFRGDIKLTSNASDHKNEIVTDLKQQPITEKHEVVQGKFLVNNEAVGANVGKLIEGKSDSIPSSRDNGRSLNGDKGKSVSVKHYSPCASEKVIDINNPSKMVTASSSYRSNNSEFNTPEYYHRLLKSQPSLEQRPASDVKNSSGLLSAAPKQPSYTMPTLRNNNLNLNIGQDEVNEHSQFDLKQTSASREPPNTKSGVIDGDVDNDAVKTAQAAIQIVDNNARNLDKFCDPDTLKPCDKSVTGENSSNKMQEEVNQGSQFEQKTMNVMRGGEMVQVSYKVYIPKKTPALARRQLKR